MSFLDDIGTALKSGASIAADAGSIYNTFSGDAPAVTTTPAPAVTVQAPPPAATSALSGKTIAIVAGVGVVGLGLFGLIMVSARR